MMETLQRYVEVTPTRQEVLFFCPVDATVILTLLRVKKKHSHSKLNSSRTHIYCGQTVIRVLLSDHITCKGSDSALDVVIVVALNATPMLAKEERWSGDEENSADGKNSEDAVPDRTPLLQEDPGQEGGDDRITGDTQCEEERVSDTGATL